MTLRRSGPKTTTRTLTHGTDDWHMLFHVALSVCGPILSTPYRTSANMDPRPNVSRQQNVVDSSMIPSRVVACGSTLLLWFSPRDQGIPRNRPPQTTNGSAYVVNDSPKFAAAILTNSVERNPLAIQSSYQSRSSCSGAGASNKSLRAAVLFVQIEVFP